MRRMNFNQKTISSKDAFILPAGSFLFTSSFEIIGESRFDIPKAQNKSGFFLYDQKQKKLMRLFFFPLFYNLIAYRRKIYMLSKAKSMSKNAAISLNSRKKYLYRDLYRFYALDEIVFHFVGMGYKLRYYKRKKKLRLYLWVGFCTWQVIRLPFYSNLFIRKESFRLLSLKIFAADKNFRQLILTLRNIRPAEPYKGKGIRFMDEVVKRKPGKTGRI